MFIMPSPTKHFYVIDLSQTVIPPKGRKVFEIGFTPSFACSVNDTLLITATGGEVHRLYITGSGGNTVDILDEKITFGSTIIGPTPYVKNIVVRNNDTENQTPVWFETHIGDFIVNNGKHLVLQPAEERKVKIEYLASLCGEINERIDVIAPNNDFQSIEVSATTGPILFQPVCDNLFFKPIIGSDAASIHLPLTNVTCDTIQILVTVPKQSPFSIQVLDKKKFNHFDDSSVAVKPYESGEIEGSLIVLGRKTVAIVEIMCSARMPGTFKATLQIQLLKPRKWLIATLNLYGVNVDTKYMLRQPNIVSKLRRFFRYPGLDPSDYVIQSTPPSIARAEPYKSYFQLDPDVLEMHTHDDRMEYVFVLSSDGPPTIKYNVILSAPFTTHSDISGEISNGETKDIVISLPKRVVDLYKDSQETFIVYGSILVVDERGEGLIGASIQAVFGELVCVDALPSLKKICFPLCKPQENFKRTVSIRNKCSIPLHVSCTLLNLTRNNPEGGRMSIINGPSSNLSKNSNFSTRRTSSLTKPGAQGSIRGDVFTLSPSSFNLKPYSFYEIDISCHPSTEGHYKASLSISYTDPIAQSIEEEGGNEDKPIDDDDVTRQLRYFEIESSVGLSTLTFSQAQFEFGDVRLKEKSSKSMTIYNNSVLDASVVISSPRPFYCLQFITIPMKSEFNFYVSCEPTQLKAYNTFLTVSTKSETFQIPLQCRGGISRLTSNLAEPVRFNEEGYLKIVDPKNVIDFDLISNAHGKRMRLELMNNGSYDMTLKKIGCEFGPVSFYVMDPEFPIPEQLLWTMIDATNKMADVNLQRRQMGRKVWSEIFLHNFDRDDPSSTEFDWDEIDSQLTNLQAKLNLNDAIEFDKSTRKPKKKMLTGVVKEGTEMKMPELDFGDGLPNLLSILNSFPFWLPPYQKIPVCLLVKEKKNVCDQSLMRTFHVKLLFVG
jgi:hypothetical protein